MAINLPGDDADTTGAVYGQLAGVITVWMPFLRTGAKLASELIERLADDLPPPGVRSARSDDPQDRLAFQERGPRSRM